MSTLYIRLPSQAVANRSQDWLALACPFALVTRGKTITQQGDAPLSALRGAIAQARRVALLLAASDVTLLRVKVPPLSPARLKAALPNLVEEHILGDPADCVIVADSPAGGLRTVAVVQRSCLDKMASTLAGYGARQIAALPAQLCLPYQSGTVLASIGEHRAGIDLTLRLSEHEGIGLALSADPHETAAHVSISALSVVAPAEQIALYVPQTSVASFQNEISRTGNQRINVSADNWSHWIAGVEAASLDLMAGQTTKPASISWRAWRWPLGLAAALLLINIAALNLEWWRMKREADMLRASMIQTYKSSYPMETVIIDPTAQMRQKITVAQRASGQAAPDDLTAIIAALGEAWASAATAPATGAIAGFDYRDRTLFVKLKPGSLAPTQQIKAALALRNLSLEWSPTPSSTAVWEIRSAK